MSKLTPENEVKKWNTGPKWVNEDDTGKPYNQYYEVCLNCLCSGFSEEPPQPAITCSKLIIEILKQGVKYVQS